MENNTKNFQKAVPVSKLTFSIEGKAKAKQSMRQAKWGNYMTSLDVVEYANWVKLNFRMVYPQHDCKVFEDKPLQIIVDEYREVPKTKPKWCKEKNYKAFVDKALADKIRPIVKPDTDNISKNIKDALNKLAYPDDSQVVTEVIRKWYANKSMVRVSISELEQA